MNDPFRHLQRLERELGDITLQLTQGHFNLYGAADRWRPTDWPGHFPNGAATVACTYGSVRCTPIQAGSSWHSCDCDS